MATSLFFGWGGFQVKANVMKMSINDSPVAGLVRGRAQSDPHPDVGTY